MQWLNEPASWQRTGDVLRVSVDPGTDFWRRTGYGYVHDNGHVYGAVFPGDLDVSVRVRGAFASNYDQAGIMLRAGEDIWLKAGLEFFEGRPRLSTVVTVGWSSWMVADLPPGTDEVTLRASRRGDAVEVRYATVDGPPELAALVFMPPDREMLAGIVCAAPEGAGFSVSFHDLRVVGREWTGQEAADGAGWAGEPEAGWDDDRADAPGWPEVTSGGRTAGWDEEKTNDAGPGWAPGQSAKPVSDWAPGQAGEPGSGWTGDKAQKPVSGWTGDNAQEPVSGWTGGKAQEPVSGRAAGKTGQAGRAPSKVPGPGGERPGSEPLDWAKPQASDAAEDWERLSLSVSSTWNAFAAAKPPREQPQEPAEDLPDKPGADQVADQAARDGADDAGEAPEPPAGGSGESGPDAHGRMERGRNKDNQPAASAAVLPAPADPADEWISLLTADSAEDLSGPAAAPRGSGPGPQLPGPGRPGP
jgi:regulation of enolase protein 1 (concanavalin A-like superfamily)